MLHPQLQEWRIKLFADGAHLESMIKLSTHPLIKGFTTNPTIMRQAGVDDYESLECLFHGTNYEVF